MIEFATVYQELKQLAFSRLRKLPPGQTLHATALVHEVYMKLSKYHADSDPFPWSNRRVFFSAASEAMRRIVIDHYRSKKSHKRGGLCERRPADLSSLPDTTVEIDLLALEEVLGLFELEYPEKAHLVKLRYFVGMTMPQCADAMGISLSTTQRHWRFARAWLAEKLDDRSNET